MNNYKYNIKLAEKVINLLLMYEEHGYKIISIDNVNFIHKHKLTRYNRDLGYIVVDDIVYNVADNIKNFEIVLISNDNRKYLTLKRNVINEYNY